MFGLLTPVLYPLNPDGWEARATIDDVSRIVQHAERIGFSFITCGDHGALGPEDAGRYGSTRFYDAIATLSYLASQTSSIYLATYVYQVALRSPLATAKALATLDRLSHGRLIAGFGAGSRRHEVEAAGHAFENRGRIVENHIRTIQSLWAVASHATQSADTTNHQLICDPAPVQASGPPVWVGGGLRVGLPRALRLGQGWAGWMTSPSALHRRLTELDRVGNWADRLRTFDVIVHLSPLAQRRELGTAPPSNPPPMTRHAAEETRELIAEWLEAGASGFLVDLRAASVSGYLETLDWFVEDIAMLAGLCRSAPPRSLEAARSGLAPNGHAPRAGHTGDVG